MEQAKKDFVNSVDNFLNTLPNVDEKECFLQWGQTHLLSLRYKVKSEQDACLPVTSGPRETPTADSAPSCHYSAPTPVSVGVADLPPISGREAELLSIVHHSRPVFQQKSNLDMTKVASGFAMVLHMHQPTIPSDTGLMSHLGYMLANEVRKYAPVGGSLFSSVLSTRERETITTPPCSPTAIVGWVT